jgi:hypothetical protein
MSHFKSIDLLFYLFNLFNLLGIVHLSQQYHFLGLGKFRGLYSIEI